jgi:hypothetical protein
MHVIFGAIKNSYFSFGTELSPATVVSSTELEYLSKISSLTKTSCPIPPADKGKFVYVSVSLDNGLTRSPINESAPFTFSQDCNPPDCNKAGIFTIF